MKYLDLTMPAPAANLALDEALLDHCEAGFEHEILRFWEPEQPFVVLGYGNKVETEVNVPECQSREIPILRRCSGGGTILQGPGCLNYSVILRIRDELQGIPQTNSFVMDRQRAALAEISGQQIAIRGHTDLVADNVKFSGNAQRRKKNFLIFHGTLLLNFDIPLIEKCLRMPSYQPEYRKDRSHVDFLMNLNLASDRVKTALRKIWNAHDPMEMIPDVEPLVAEKYGRAEWNLKF